MSLYYTVYDMLSFALTATTLSSPLILATMICDGLWLWY